MKVENNFVNLQAALRSPIVNKSAMARFGLESLISDRFKDTDIQAPVK